MNGKKYPRTWELINQKQDWERLKVPGGWLVHHSSRYLNREQEMTSECVSFVSDPLHEWNLE